VQPFANSCRAAGNDKLSVSDQLLQHFMARGFTLESVCLAFSSVMRFDPETGRQLPLAFVREIGEVPLNVPTCFRGGTFFQDCALRFDQNWGQRLKPRQLAEHREFARSFDVNAREFIQRNRLSGVFYRLDMAQNRFPQWLQSTYFEWIIASRGLPRGYGYALHGPEGDDPEIETINLTTYRRKGNASSLWSD
jgi:hypothetical protein